MLGLYSVFVIVGHGKTDSCAQAAPQATPQAGEKPEQPRPEVVDFGSSAFPDR